MPESSERTALYRLYDAAGQLLYIGITNSPEARWARHKMLRTWGARMARKEVAWFASREAAEAAEEDAIRLEAPLFNGTHNYPLAPFDGTTWPQVTGRGGRSEALAELMRQAIRDGTWPVGSKIPTCRALGEATGAGKTAATHAVRVLQREGLLELLHGFGLFVVDGDTDLRPHSCRNPAA